MDVQRRAQPLERSKPNRAEPHGALICAPHGAARLGPRVHVRRIRRGRCVGCATACEHSALQSLGYGITEASRAALAVLVDEFVRQ